MISIATDKRQLKFNDQNQLAEFCASCFQRLSPEVVDSLRQGLALLESSTKVDTQFCAALALEAAKLTVLKIEEHKKARNTDIKLKAPVPEAAIRLKEMAAGTPEFKDILPYVVQLHASSVGIHDSMHAGSRKVRVNSDEPPHTAIHALGHISQIIIYLPQLRALAPKGLLQESNMFSGLVMPSRALWKPVGFSPEAIAVPQNPITEMLKLVRSGGSLHLK